MIYPTHCCIQLAIPRDKCAANEGRRSDAAFVRGVGIELVCASGLDSIDAVMVELGEVELLVRGGCGVE